MKKHLLIFFLSFTIPLFIAAQQKIISAPTQLPPTQKSVLPITNTTTQQPAIKATTQSSKIQTPLNKGTVTNNQKNKFHSVHKKKIAGALYGNEWINYSQYYFKFKIGQNGIYRIDSATLAKSGVPVDTIKTDHYQVFFRGKQQYIYVRSRTTYLSEKNGDYIEFYAQGNDGVPDSTIYDNIKFLPNPYYSLFSDTSTYYLTWSSTATKNRMTEQTDTSWTTNHYTAAAYVITSTVAAGTSTSGTYSEGIWVPAGESYTPNDPRYTQNSAWTEPWLGGPNYNSDESFTPNVSNIYTLSGAPAAFMRTALFGVNYNSTCTFSIYSSARNLWTNKTCTNFQAFDLDTTFPAIDITNGFNITYSNNTGGSNPDIIAPAYLYLSYPHTTNLGGAATFMMSVPNDTAVGYTKTYLDFTNFSISTSADSVRMYDLTNHRRFWVKPEFGGFNVLVPNNAGPAKLNQCYLTSDSLITKVKSLTPVGINYATGGRGNGQFTNFSSEPDSVFIIVTHPSLWSSALAYKAYRSNRYNVILADVEELYDQFGEGVYYSPLGIRNFCNYAINNWASPPSNLFLFGKGIHSYIFRQYPSDLPQLLVPSYGYPSSDILFTNGLGDAQVLEPAIPTGRLAAQNTAQANLYLQKVETYESTPAALWMKNIALFAGGSDPGEVSLFASFLEGFANAITGPLFGAHSSLFEKTTSVPINGNLTDSITNLINNGVSIMNFFGHADGSNWDESIDHPSDYTNVGKYPFIIADACFSGDIFEPIGTGVTTVSEEFVLEPPGAIAFLAADYLGNAGPLDTYTQNFYNALGRPFYRKPIGSIIQNTIAQTQNTNYDTGFTNDQYTTLTCLEMGLHGDPAITLNAMDSLPDYAVNSQSISFSPANVTVVLDSFNVNITVYNYGEAADSEPVAGVLTRTFSDGSSTQYNFTLPSVYYQNTVSVRIPVNQSSHLGQGLNSFSVYVDLNPTQWKELTYTNNNLGTPVQFFITSENITPVWPYDYAIIPHDTVTLKASTDDPFAPQRTYIFEIDTSHSFNSPLFRSDTVTNSGGVITLSPFSNWGTTHFHGPIQNNLSLNKTAEKGALHKVPAENIATITNGTNAKLNPTKNNSIGNTPLLLQQNSSIALKQTALAPSNSIVAPKSNSTIQSPQLKQTTSILGQNNMTPFESHSVHGPINLSFINGAVYYWRVKGTTPSDTIWGLSSFQYLKSYNGWGQSNFFQYHNDEQLNDSYNFISFDSLHRNWNFNTSGHILECTTYGMPNPAKQYGTQYTIDNAILAASGCQVIPGIYIAVIDSTTIIPWMTGCAGNTSSNCYDFGNANNFIGSNTDNCIHPDNKFIFWDDVPSQMDSLVKMLKSIHNGYYILAYSWMEGAFKTSSGLTNANAVVSEFAHLGATQMPAHANTPGMDSVPWAFFVQKGHPTSAIQAYGRNANDSARLFAVLKSNGTYGVITSSLIGPAAKYDSLSWMQHPADKPPLTDSTRLNIIGVTPVGNTQTLMSNVTPLVANMYISSINSKLYPYIQLQMYTKDVINRTPSQMNYWRVFYQPVPEIAMNPHIYSYLHADTLAYGDIINFQTVVQNISDWPIDSTQLLVWTTNQKNNIQYYYPKRYVKPLKPGDTAKVSFPLPDAYSSTNGMQSIWFEVNPIDYPNTRVEQFHFNDYAYKTFYSYGDKINPVLDVTFDGIHILNNDIVSAQPNILITFMDENKFLALNNPSNFHVYLNPVGSPLQAIPFVFTPAVLPKNRASLLVTPSLTDGKYQLTVQGTDISNNPSANNNYVIDFQVITKSMISSVVNYPNPFSTSTRFVFTLTGSQIPTIFKIQIMTITGTIVREINEDEIGPIHIGTNITQYAWDGTDKYGSKLANGVYLYRVVTSINGQSISNYQTAADQYFTKGWGKMYLMR